MTTQDAPPVILSAAKNPSAHANTTEKDALTKLIGAFAKRRPQPPSPPAPPTPAPPPA